MSVNNTEKYLSYEEVNDKFKNIVEKETLKMNRKEAFSSYKREGRSTVNVNNLTKDEYKEYVDKIKSFNFKLINNINFLESNDKEFLKKRDKVLIISKIVFYLGYFGMFWGLYTIYNKKFKFNPKRLYFGNFIIGSTAILFFSHYLTKYSTQKLADILYAQRMYEIINYYS